MYGTIIMLSVLAILSDTKRGTEAGTAFVAVAGTSFVLFFAHVYSGSVAERVQFRRALSMQDLQRLIASSWPVVAVTAWPLVLLALSAIGILETRTAITLSIWLAVGALGVWGWRAATVGQATLSGRLWSTAISVVVGLLIVALKVALH